MSEPLIPAWMQREHDRLNLQNANKKAQEKQELAARLIIKSEGLLFWKAFLEKIEVSVNALPVFSLTGSLTHVGMDIFRIHINKLGPSANFARTDLFLEPARIRCNEFAHNSYGLQLCVLSDNSIAVIANEAPMNPEDASEFVIRRMMTLIENQANGVI